MFRKIHRTRCYRGLLASEECGLGGRSRQFDWFVLDTELPNVQTQ
jgi:hypothetical protein